MANNYTFLDSNSSVQTAGTSVVGGVHYPVVQITSIIAVQQAGAVITSLVSTIPSSVLVGASVIGVVPVSIMGQVPNQSVSGALQTFPQSTNSSIIGIIQGSVAAAIVSGSITTVTSNSSVQVLNFPTNQNVSGSVISYPLGTIVTSLVSTVPSSVIVGTSIFGQLPAGTAPLGSVTALQGTNPWVVNFSNSSILAVPVGSVITANPQSSVISMPAPFASLIQGTADLRTVQGASVAIVAAAGSGIRNYITHVQIANYGPSSVLVTIADNTTSILGYTIAPAGGGSNYDPLYKGATNSPITASINGTASVLVSAQGFTL